MWTVTQLSEDLASGKTTSRKLVEEALARIADPEREGARAFVKIYKDIARAEADFSDRLRSASIRRSIIDGLPISIKDLFDVAGDVTRAGSRVREHADRSTVDAAAVARLRSAGAVIVGRTNMVEFAFGAVGLNPHFGTPRNPWERSVGRVPGGSSSGAGVAQADGMCVISLGSDTRGSVRIPAALCGVAGFKPTARRIPREGAFPLSFTLDSIGPIANSIQCCAICDSILSGTNAVPPAVMPARGLRLLVPELVRNDDLDTHVEDCFHAAISRLRKVGALIEDIHIPTFERQAEYFKAGGIAGAEAYFVHETQLDRISEYDPRVGKRILMGKDISAAEYLGLMSLRSEFIHEVETITAPFDALVMPTAPCIAPTIAEVESGEEQYFAWNQRLMRYTGLVNFFDGCAATIPCQPRGTAPVGLMVCGVAGNDRRILAVAASIENELRSL